MRASLVNRSFTASGMLLEARLAGRPLHCCSADPAGDLWLMLGCGPCQRGVQRAVCNRLEVINIHFPSHITSSNLLLNLMSELKLFITCEIVHHFCKKIIVRSYQVNLMPSSSMVPFAAMQCDFQFRPCIGPSYCYNWMTVPKCGMSVVSSQMLSPVCTNMAAPHCGSRL